MTVNLLPPAASSGAVGDPSTAFIPHMNGARLVSPGHSYWNGGGAGNGIGVPGLLSKRQALSNWTNLAVSGETSAAIVRVLLAWWTSGNIGSFYGYIVAIAGANDAYGDLTNWPGMTAAGAANMRALIEIARSSTTRIENAAGTYTGTWSSVSDVGASGGTYHKTATQGDYVDVTVSGDRCCILLQGISTAEPGISSAGLGATFSVALASGGANLAAGTTAFGATNNQVTLVQPVVITGLGSGSHPLRITKTDATTNELRFDAVLTPSATPPTVVLVSQPPVTNRDQTFCDAANLAMTSAAAFYSASEVVVVPIPAAPLVSAVEAWNIATCEAPDGLHPNERGHNSILAATEATIAALTWRVGQNA